VHHPPTALSTSTTAAADGRLTIVLIESGRDDIIDRLICTGALDRARSAGVHLHLERPPAATAAAQRELLGGVTRSWAGSVVLVPTRYDDLEGAVRAAHDREVPVIVAGAPRPASDNGLAWSFVSSAAEGDAVAAAIEVGRVAVDAAMDAGLGRRDAARDHVITPDSRHEYDPSEASPVACSS
jgi:hypothetical protein